MGISNHIKRKFMKNLEKEIKKERKKERNKEITREIEYPINKTKEEKSCEIMYPLLF